ncbi:MAG TPA: CPBP family intramembrane glutamic endopeptidase, partial [Spirochaetia bacterium]|nr:CPBP family intramembrane glutamic endopeptidase [Spirochaetia bacterium]
FVGPRKGRESYLQLLTAPYDPGISLDYRAIPIVGLELAAFLSPDTLATMGAYFQRSTVSFAGLAMSPWAGLALETAYALVLNLFVATAEESIFRGIVLEALGPAWTALIFGAGHIPNILTYKTIDADSITQVALQSAFATLAGYYLSVVTVDKGYDLRTAIAYHYWHNVVAMITGFLYDEGKAAASDATGSTSSGLSIGFSPADLELSVSIPLR